MSFDKRWLFAALLLGLGCSGLRAEDTPFPADSGVVDVTKPPYNAKGDGITDDTAALQAALDTRGKIVYLPNGVYLISATLKYPPPQKRQVFQGQSLEKTIVRLKDNCPGFNQVGSGTNSEGKAISAKAMIWTGAAPAQRFRNGIRNLYFDTGKGNPGAIAVQYIANNQGALREVRIVSGDGQGKIGLDLGYSNEQGPCLIKNVQVSGFEVGVRTAFAVDSVVLEDIRLSGQSVAGFINSGQCLSVRGLRSTNAVPAFLNRGNGVVTLIDSELTGTGAAARLAAITNQAGLFVRNVKTSGYKAAVENLTGTKQGASGPEVREWGSHEPVSPFGDGRRSLNLPIQETPVIPWGNPAKDWASVAQFLPPESLAPGVQDVPVEATEAFQKAIDAGKKTVYFPLGINWKFSGTVRVRGKVERIIGLEQGGPTWTGTLAIEDGEAPAVLLERFDWNYAKVTVRHASKRTLILSSISGSTYQPETNAGDLFIEDVVASPWQFHQGQHIWARQLNTEGGKRHILNDGAVLWIFGQKTEGDGCLSETCHGGRTEVCGGFAYANTAGSKPLMFKVTDSWLSASLGGMVLRQSPFQAVEETRAGHTKTLPLNGGRFIPLVVCGPEAH